MATKGGRRSRSVKNVDLSDESVAELGVEQTKVKVRLLGFFGVETETTHRHSMDALAYVLLILAGVGAGFVVSLILGSHSVDAGAEFVKVVEPKGC